MNIFSKTLLCAGMMAGVAITANAFTLTSPNPSETLKVKTLSSLSLVWSSEVEEFPDKSIQVLDSSNKQVSTGSLDLDFDNWSAYAVKFSPAVTTAGTYTIVVPANMAGDNNNPEYRITCEVEGAVAATTCMPTSVDPEPGSSIVQSLEDGVQFDNIQLTFGNDASLTLDESKISLRNEGGTAIPFGIGGFYKAEDPMLQYAEAPFVKFSFNTNGDMPSGVYTLTALPGAFTGPSGAVNEKTLTYTYNYTKTKAEVDETPLEILTALMGHVTLPSAGKFVWDGTDALPVVADMPVKEFVGTNNADLGTGFLLTFNHGEKSSYVTYALIEESTNEILRSGECSKQEDGSFLLGWPMTLRLESGKKYILEFRTYNNITEKVEFGDGASLTFVGASEAYQYSSAKFVTVVPTSGEVLTQLKQNKITVLFTEPVKVTAKVSLGMGGSGNAVAESSNEEEYDYVWYVYIPEKIMLQYPDANMSVVAYGKDGRIVAGNNGSIEGDSNCEFHYTMTLCQPRVLLEQTNSHVADIQTFSVYSPDGRGIMFSYNAYPYVINEKGETVATLNQEAYTGEDGEKVAYKALSWTSGNEYERSPLVMEFQMTPAITEKGKYTLVCPDYTFNIGTQFDSDISVEQEFNYWVTDFFPVTYSVDNNTVALSPVEITRNANLEITAAEGWKLESLTLNDTDVTADVTNGKYTSPAADKAMAFKATFAFDGIVAEPSSAADIVTDLELRGWSENGKLYVAGLKDGQNVSVYTAGGCLMTSVNVENADTMQFDVEAGVYIITVTEGTTRVALKLINK